MASHRALGFLGIQLDAPRGNRRADRWNRWRPTVALCQQDDLVFSRYDLLAGPKNRRLAQEVAEDLASTSPETEVVVHELTIEDPWDFGEVYGALLDWIRGQDFDPDDEELLVHITTGTHVMQICLFLLTEARYLPGRLIQTSPPSRGSGGPTGTTTIIDLDLSRYDAIAARFRVEHDQGTSFLKSGIETRNERFNALIDRIERVAIQSRAPFLLTGPTGAGKSQLARRIFELKAARKQVAGDFVEVNCATLRGDAAMSALFGHVRGAYTGAETERPGLLRRADGGVLFLDEIGELGLDEQAMLLRAVEEGRFLPVGGDDERESEFQLIAGTHRDLADEVRRGGFREDLLARLDLWTFGLPGLAERPEDIEPNLDYELERFAQEEGVRTTFNREARQLFLRFATSAEARWERNFRDLNGAVVRMATVCHGGRITVVDVREEIERLRRRWGSRAEGESVLGAWLDEEQIDALDLFDRLQLESILPVLGTCTSLSDAGRKLFAVSRERKTSSNDADRLRKYLARFDLDWKRIQGSLRRS